METTLRMFYARAFGLVLLVLVLLFALLMMAAPAFAQAATAPAQPAPDFIDLLFSTTSAAVYWLIGLVWLALKPPAWIKDFFATKDASQWDGILDTGLDRAEALVRKWGIDATKDRNGWINGMITGLSTFNPEIVEYFDKNKNGVIDFLEGYIPPREAKVAPGLVALIATRLPEGTTAPATPAKAAPLPFAATPRGVRRKGEAVQ